MAHLPVHLIVGDDAFLVQAQVERVLGEIPEMGVEEFGPETDISAIVQSLNTPSFFDAQRTIVLRGADSLDAESQRALISYLEQPSEGATLILVSSKPVQRLAAAVKKIGKVHDAVRGKRADLIPWLREQAKERKLRAGSETLALLIDAVGEERVALAQALDELKLAVPTGVVTNATVTTHFRSRHDTKVFGFIDAVATRQAGPALESLGRLLRQGESPQALFWMLAKHFRLLIVAGESSATQLASQMKLQPWRAEKLVKQARAFDQGALMDATRVLAKADHKMKKSEEPEGLTLERAVVEIAGR